MASLEHNESRYIVAFHGSVRISDCLNTCNISLCNFLYSCSEKRKVVNKVKVYSINFLNIIRYGSFLTISSIVIVPLTNGWFY